MEFSRQETWSGLPFPSPGDLPDSGIDPGSPAFSADSLPSEPPGKALVTNRKTVQWPNHLLFKILRTYVIEPADVCSKTVWYFKNLCVKECRDSPRVKTMPSKAEGVGLIPGLGAGAPCASQPKNKNIKQKRYFSQFNKYFKMVYIQKKFKNKNPYVRIIILKSAF